MNRDGSEKSDSYITWNFKKINKEELNDLFHLVHKKEVLEGTEPEVTYHLFYVTVKYHLFPETFFDIQTWFDIILP